ncbi:MAG: glycosyltransferase family 2 protein [Marinilabilia sp.]
MIPEIVIQLVLYRDADFLPGLVRSLRAQSFPDFKILALDNGGGDGTGERFLELFPEGELLKSHENLGYAGGHNFLLSRTLKISPPFVVMMNTDIELDRDFLKGLYEHMMHCPDVDACGPLVLEGNKHQAGEKVQNYRLFMDFPGARKWSPDAGKVLTSVKELPVSADVDYFSGVALMFRTPVLRKTGLWDERLFLYGEERDFFYRFGRDGHLAMVTRRAICRHFNNTRKAGAKAWQMEYYYLRRNRVLYFRKYRFKKGLVLFLLREVVQLPVSFFWCLQKGGLRMFYAWWLGILHGLQGKTGKLWPPSERK